MTRAEVEAPSVYLQSLDHHEVRWLPNPNPSSISSRDSSLVSQQRPPLHQEDTRLWSDFLRTYLHPRSIHEVQETYHDDAAAPFLSHNEGAHVWQGRAAYSEVFEDTVRQYVEECDSAQGFQVRILSPLPLQGVS